MTDPYRTPACPKHDFRATIESKLPYRPTLECFTCGYVATPEETRRFLEPHPRPLCACSVCNFPR